MNKHLFPASCNLDTPNHKRIQRVTKFGFVVDGVELIDLGCNMSATIIGFDRHDIVDYVAEQLKTLSVCPSEYETDSAHVATLSDAIYNDTGSYSFFSLSGSDSIEMAVRSATIYHYRRGNKAKHNIIGFQHSYHGSNLLNYRISGLDPATGRPGSDTGGFIHLPNVRHYDTVESFEHQTIERIRRIFNSRSDISCIVQESCSWGSHLKTLSSDYWNKLQTLCNSFDVLLIVDDIAMSGGKTGSLYGFDRTIDPDIFCVGKSFGGGYFPLAVTCVQPHVKDAISSYPFPAGYTHSFHIPGIVSANYYHNVLKKEGIFDNNASIIAAARDVCDRLEIDSYSNHGTMVAINLNRPVDSTLLEQVLRRNGLNLGFIAKLPVTDVIIWCVPIVADDYYFNRVHKGLSDTLKCIK